MIGSFIIYKKCGQETAKQEALNADYITDIQPSGVSVDMCY